MDAGLLSVVSASALVEGVEEKRDSSVVRAGNFSRPCQPAFSLDYRSWSRTLVEICWVPACYRSRQLFPGNPQWGGRRGAGQALRCVVSARTVGNKPAQQLFYAENKTTVFSNSRKD